MPVSVSVQMTIYHLPLSKDNIAYFLIKNNIIYVIKKIFRRAFVLTANGECKRVVKQDRGTKGRGREFSEQTTRLGRVAGMPPRLAPVK